MPASPNDDITIIVEPSSGILRAMWARPLLTGGLIDSYYHLLNEAVRAGCRFWQVDLRLRIWPAATFGHWLVDTFAQLATQRFGAPVYVAGWVGSQHQHHIAAPLTLHMRTQVAKTGFYLDFFEKEPDARAWLVRQQQTEREAQTSG